MKPTIAVFFGCRSVEHEISIISAVQAMHAINREKYDILPVYITKTRELYTGERLTDIEAFKDIPGLLSDCRRVALVREDGAVWAKLADKKGYGKRESVRVDLGFPIVHGTNGEDGTVAGYLEMLGLPYIGCSPLAGAVSMDKSVSKAVLREAGLPVLPSVTFTARRYATDRAGVEREITEKTGYPLIIKPVNLGSSVGITKVADEAGLAAAVELAGSFAGEIMTERAVEHLREINCAVLGEGENCEASLLEEPVSAGDILSYKDKYEGGGEKGMASATRKCPADLPPAKAEEIRSLACRAFAAVKCSGVARVDFLLDTAGSDRVWVNEINTIPGSLSFYLWEPMGVPYSALIDRLADIAFRRERERERLMFTVETNVLSRDGLKFSAKGAKTGSQHG